MRKQISSQWLIMLLRRLFHPSDTLFVRFLSVKVVSWTFHKTGGNRAVRYYQRDARRPQRTSQQNIAAANVRHISDWQKGYSVQHTNEIVELIVVFIFCSQTQ